MLKSEKSISESFQLASFVSPETENESPTEKKGFKKSLMAPINYLKKLQYYFGTKFLFFVTNNYLFVKGIAMSSVDTLLVEFYNELGQSSLVLQEASVFIEIPWSIKGIIGVVSDIFPLMGYTKRSYMALYSVLGSVSAILLCVLPKSTFQSTIQFSYILFALTFLQISSFDLLCEGKYTRVMMDNPETRGDIVTYIWMIQQIANIIVGFSIGPILDNAGTFPLLIVIAICLVQAAVFAILNFVDDKPVEKYLKNKVNYTLIKKLGVYFFVATISGVLLVLAGISTLFVSSPLVAIIIYSVIAVGLTIMSYLLLPRCIANCNLYMFTAKLGVSFGAPLKVWYLGDEQCVPGGPHFNYTFYQTVGLVVGNLSALAACIILQAFMMNWTYRAIFWFSTIISCIAGLNDYIIMQRWYLAIGLSDKLVYFVGDGIVQNLISMLYFLPGTLLLSRVCPRSIESTVYATLAGFSNFGNLWSRAMGRYVQEQMGISLNRATGVCKYDGLKELILVNIAISIILSIPIGFILLPHYRLNEVISEADLLKDQPKCLKSKYVEAKSESTEQEQDGIDLAIIKQTIE